MHRTMILIHKTLQRVVITAITVYVVYRYVQKSEANRAELEAFRAAKAKKEADDIRTRAALAPLEAAFEARIAEKRAAMTTEERIDYDMRKIEIYAEIEDEDADYPYQKGQGALPPHA